MENLKELAELLLPQGILDYFDYKSYETEDEEIIITLVEKNTVPKLPEQYKSRKIRQKGFFSKRFPSKRKESTTAIAQKSMADSRS